MLLFILVEDDKHEVEETLDQRKEMQGKLCNKHNIFSYLSIHPLIWQNNPLVRAKNMTS